MRAGHMAKISQIGGKWGSSELRDHVVNNKSVSSRIENPGIFDMNVSFMEPQLGNYFSL